MDKQLLKFMNREVSAVKVMCCIGTEQIADGGEFVTIRVDQLQTDLPLYAFWNNPHRKQRKDGSTQPKHTGGKVSYIKVIIRELRKYSKDMLSYEYAGMLLQLTSFIEWDTGMLMIGRGKKKHRMTRDDIIRELGVDKSTVKRFTKNLKEIGLLRHDKDGYEMTGNLFAKGRSVPCVSNLKKG
jgi:hypothetical protein